MRNCLCVLLFMAPAGTAAADASLAEMLGTASACSDAALQAKSSTCEAPEKAAALAIAKCQREWNAVADKAVGPVPAHASRDVARERERSMKIYSEAMENEYIRVAELKVIDIRRDSNTCGFE